MKLNTAMCQRILFPNHYKIKSLAQPVTLYWLTPGSHLSYRNSNIFQLIVMSSICMSEPMYCDIDMSFIVRLQYAYEAMII